MMVTLGQPMKAAWAALAREREKITAQSQSTRIRRAWGRPAGEREKKERDETVMRMIAQRWEEAGRQHAARCLAYLATPIWLPTASNPKVH